ncbi:hypothetical protein ABZ698_10705 [Streptomyces antibioticus]
MTVPGRGRRGRDRFTVSSDDDVAEFAALLTPPKARTERSYGSLARRLGMNTSTLHRYRAELDWSFQGRTGTVRIDDRGRPFRTSGIEGLSRYMYDTGERRWRPYV